MFHLKTRNASRLTHARRSQYSAALEEINQGSGCDRFIATFADDMRLVLPDRQVLNRDFWQADLEEILRVGVRIHLTNLMVSGDMLLDLYRRSTGLRSEEQTSQHWRPSRIAHPRFRIQEG